MTLFGITALMILVIIIGKGSKEFGLKQFIIIGLITLVQVCITVFEMFTKPAPPLH